MFNNVLFPICSNWNKTSTDFACKLRLWRTSTNNGSPIWGRTSPRWDKTWPTSRPGTGTRRGRGPGWWARWPSRTRGWPWSWRLRPRGRRSYRRSWHRWGLSSMINGLRWEIMCYIWRLSKTRWIFILNLQHNCRSFKKCFLFFFLKAQEYSAINNPFLFFLFLEGTVQWMTFLTSSTLPNFWESYRSLKYFLTWPPKTFLCRFATNSHGRPVPEWTCLIKIHFSFACLAPFLDKLCELFAGPFLYPYSMCVLYPLSW